MNSYLKLFIWKINLEGLKKNSTSDYASAKSWSLSVWGASKCKKLIE